MIGGTDHVFPVEHPAPALEALAHIVSAVWPAALFQNAETSEIYENRALPFDSVAELLVYRDDKVAQSWNDHGAMPELQNTMIHILCSEQELTIVTDEPPTAEINAIISAFRQIAAARLLIPSA